MFQCSPAAEEAQKSGGRFPPPRPKQPAAFFLDCKNKKNISFSPNGVGEGRPMSSPPGNLCARALLRGAQSSGQETCGATPPDAGAFPRAAPAPPAGTPCRTTARHLPSPLRNVHSLNPSMVPPGAGSAACQPNLGLRMGWPKLFTFLGGLSKHRWGGCLGGWVVFAGQDVPTPAPGAKRIYAPNACRLFPVRFLPQGRSSFHGP